MAAASSISLSQLPLSSFLIIKPKKPPLLFPKNLPFLTATKFQHHKIHSPQLPVSSKSWRISAISEANPAETSEQIVSTTGGDGVSTIISALLFVAFLGLSILTIGVIYIAVTDFLTKREKEKFEKEEAAKKKKSGRKGKVVARSRAGPKGFGQKVEEADDDE